MLDEETGAEPRVVSSSIADPYLLLIRDDSSVFVAQIESNNDLEEVEKTDSILTTTKWQAGCLYTDSTGAFQAVTDKGTEAGSKIMMFLLSSTGALYVGCSVSISETQLMMSRSMLCLTSPSQFTWQRA
jgi:cleavage and polyadenylation specificity factor subunit 1